MERSFCSLKREHTVDLNELTRCRSLLARHNLVLDVREMVRAAGLEPAQAFQPHGFSYHFGFRRRLSGVCGLDYPFTLA